MHSKQVTIQAHSCFARSTFQEPRENMMILRDRKEASQEEATFMHESLQQERDSPPVVVVNFRP